MQEKTALRAELPSYAEFEARMGETFKISNDDFDFEATLWNCRQVIDTPLQVCFSVVFLAPADGPQTQSMFRIENEQLGAMDLFLVPIKSDEKGLRLEAVFNLLLA